jgi:glycosyltransferase involved in cell wall biosynthesis
MGLDKRVVFLEGVSDEELALLYNRAVLFAFPSLYEGFGLPPVEAMACGTPVVSSNAASLPEILGDAAFLVEPHDVGEWCAGLRQLLTGEEVRLALREKGRIRSQTFSGERQARETVAIYQHAVREQRG